MKRLLKILVFVFVTSLFLGTSCNKQIIKPASCMWEAKLSKMKIVTGIIDSTSSSVSEKPLFFNNICSYDIFFTRILFEKENINEEPCMLTRDSLIGNIKDLLVISLKNYNQNYKANDTINSIVNIITKKRDTAFTEKLTDFNNKHISIRNCGVIDLTLTQSPDTIQQQQFKIIFTTDYGAEFIDTTISVFLTPLN